MAILMQTTLYKDCVYNIVCAILSVQCDNSRSMCFSEGINTVDMHFESR